MSQQAQVPILIQQQKLTAKPLVGGILQRKYACGQHILSGGECEECHKNREGMKQRAAVSDAPITSKPSIVHDVVSSLGQPLDARTQYFMESRFKHDFSQVRAKTDVSQILPNLAISASPETPQEVTSPTPLDAPGSYRHPFTAMALRSVPQTKECNIPTNQYGVIKFVRYRIFDFNGQPVDIDRTVNEKFKKLDGSDDLWKSLKPKSNSSLGGFFDDCYRIISPDPLPDDKSLKIEQNHILDNEIISKNHITYTSRNVMLCTFRRSPGKHNFDPNCKTL